MSGKKTYALFYQCYNKTKRRWSRWTDERWTATKPKKDVKIGIWSSALVAAEPIDTLSPWTPAKYGLSRLASLGFTRVTNKVLISLVELFLPEIVLSSRCGLCQVKLSPHSLPRLPHLVKDALEHGTGTTMVSLPLWKVMTSDRKETVKFLSFGTHQHREKGRFDHPGDMAYLHESHLFPSIDAT